MNDIEKAERRLQVVGKLRAAARRRAQRSNDKTAREFDEWVAAGRPPIPPRYSYNVDPWSAA